MKPFQENKGTRVFDFLAQEEQNQCHLNVQDLQSMLASWEEVPDLPDGKRIYLQRLLKTFRVAQKISSDSPWNRCQSLLEQTSASLKSLLKQAKASGSRRQTLQPGSHGYGQMAREHNEKVMQVVKGLLWPALGHLSLRRGEDKAYTQFLSQVLVCVAVLKNEADPKMVQKVLKGARDMAKDPESHGLPLLPHKLVAPEVYLQALAGLPRYRWLPYMERLLEDAMDVLGMDELEPQDGDSVDEAGDELDEEALEQMDPEPLPEEDFDGDEFEVDALQQGEDCEPCESPKKPRRRGDAGRAIAKANQLFPFSWNALSRGDLHLLMHAFHARAKSQTEDWPLLLVQMMFWTGFNEERLAEIRLGGPEFFEKFPTADWYDPHHEILYVYSPYPTLKSLPEGKWQFAKPANRMELRLPQICRDMLADHIPQSLFHTGELMSELDSVEIKDDCQEWLSELKKKAKKEFGHTPLMTLKRIQKHLAQSASRRGAADSAVANLMLGREDHLGRTKVHYLSTDTERLKQHYQKVTFSMIDGAGLKTVGGRRHG